MARAKYMLIATALGVPVGGLLVILSGRDGTEALVEFVLCISTFALCGFFARANWFDVAWEFFSRSSRYWF